MASIGQFNTTQLRNALLDREVQRRKLANVETEKQHVQLLLHMDTLLTLVPNHQRTSCSDEHPCNFVVDITTRATDCVRCQLLRLKEQNYNDDTSVRITLEGTPLEPTDKVDIEVSFKER